MTRFDWRVDCSSGSISSSLLLTRVTAAVDQHVDLSRRDGMMEVLLRKTEIYTLILFIIPPLSHTV
jgi:hypothetical protein